MEWSHSIHVSSIYTVDELAKQVCICLGNWVHLIKIRFSVVERFHCRHDYLTLLRTYIYCIVHSTNCLGLFNKEDLSELFHDKKNPLQSHYTLLYVCLDVNH